MALPLTNQQIQEIIQLAMDARSTGYASSEYGLSCSLLRLHNPDKFDFGLEDDDDNDDYIDDDIDDECEAMDHIMNFKVPSRPTVWPDKVRRTYGDVTAGL